MSLGKNRVKQLLAIGKDANFLRLIHWIENLVTKALSLALLVIILVGSIDLILFIIKDIFFFSEPLGFFSKALIELFGLFLNILIALELLENISGYLRKHIFQVELVIVTSLIAVARKIIIFDLQKHSNNDLIALGVAILALSVSYWLIRSLPPKNQD